jgi:hypothetical protein
VSEYDRAIADAVALLWKIRSEETDEVRKDMIRECADVIETLTGDTP